MNEEYVYEERVSPNGDRLRIYYDCDSKYDPAEERVGTFAFDSATTHRWTLWDEVYEDDIERYECPDHWADAGIEMPLTCTDHHAFMSLPLFLADYGSNGNKLYIERENCARMEWNERQNGVIYCDDKKKLKEFGVKKKDLMNVLYEEAKQYKMYIEGEVYGFELTNSEGVHVESCWGYYGDDGIKQILAENEATEWKESDL